jgi:hypothetical protein
MAKSQVSKGQDFSVARLDRSHRGLEKEILKIDGETGDLVIKDLAGTEVLKVTAATGVLEINGQAAIGTTGTALALSGDLEVAGDVGFYGTAAVAQPSAYTQTYATAAKTVALATVVAQTAVTDNGGGAAADGTIAAITNAANAGSADVAPVADAIKELSAKINLLVTAVNALTADSLADRKAVNALIDDLQALGLVA